MGTSEAEKEVRARGTMRRRTRAEVAWGGEGTSCSLPFPYDDWKTQARAGRVPDSTGWDKERLHKVLR